MCQLILFKQSTLSIQDTFLTQLLIAVQFSTRMGLAANCSEACCSLFVSSSNCSTMTDSSAMAKSGTNTGEKLATPAHDVVKPSSDLPQMTTGTSRDYTEEAYFILANAMLSNPVWKVMFSADEDMADEDRVELYHGIIRQYHFSRAQKGGFVAEAGNFAACALWWPPGSQEPTRRTKNQDGTEEFENEARAIESEYMWSRYGNDFWQLALIGRDPSKPVVPGAVRAILQPHIDLAAAEHKPIWLTTTSEHAKDMYLHFGFQIVATTERSGHKTWAMQLLPPNQISK